MNQTRRWLYVIFLTMFLNLSFSNTSEVLGQHFLKEKFKRVRLIPEVWDSQLQLTLQIKNS